MERRKIKVGETYAYLRYGKYDEPIPIRIVKVEKGILAVRLDKIGNPLVKEFVPEVRKIVRTWAEEIELVRATRMAEEARRADLKRQVDALEERRQRLLSLVGTTPVAMQRLAEHQVKMPRYAGSVYLGWEPTLDEVIEIVEHVLSNVEITMHDPQQKESN